jgi:HEAT repeat protein
VKAKGLAVNLALSLFVTVGFAAALEGVARLVETRSPAAAPVANYIWDWREKMPGDFYVIHSEAVGWPPWEEINADGLRDRTHPVEKPEGVHRVVALGDSVTLGAGIQPQEAYPQVLERRLRREGRRVEVMNVGLWGWSTRQQRMAYERIVKKYRPDQVILAVCLNDIPEIQNNLTRPHPLLAAIYRKSALVRVAIGAHGREIKDVEQLFADPTGARVQEAYARFLDEVRALRAEVESSGATFALMLFPFRFQVLPGAPEPWAQREVEQFCRRESIRYLDLLPVLGPHGGGAFVDYDHLSPSGAVATADAVMSLLPEAETEPQRLEPTLGRPATAASVADLSALLRDRDAAVQAAAAWALEQRGAAAAPSVDALTAALGDPSARVRSAAARALGAIGPAARAATGRLFEALRDPVTDVRWQAASALSKLDLSAPAVVAPLAAALESDDAYVRGFAAWSLGNLGPAASDAVPALIAALARDDGYGRGGAAAALARMGPAAAAAVPALLDGLKSADGDRRWKAARTLGRIGPEARAAIEPLTAALRDPNVHVRRHAARALGRLGELPADTQAGLRAVSSDGDDEVRREARKALGR